MDSFTLPTEFDVIVVGTGLTESIISAAASRIGKSVLHIDNQQTYGGDWASFNLESIQKLSELCNEALETDSGNSLHIGSKSQLKSVTIEWHINEKNDDSEGDTTKWTQEMLLAKSNKFIIDLVPKLHFANGELVNLLISSNIARYTEFRSVSRIMTMFSEKLVIIPCSRNDIFTDSDITVIEKRLLMKLFTSIMDDDSIFEENADRLFKDVLLEMKLTPKVIHYIIHAIAMTTMDVSCGDGLKRVKRFLKSIGRFGKTPFLYCMWGSAEIPQAFCRISAVFGGVYALNQPLKEYRFDGDSNFTSLICGEQEITAKKLVTGVGCKPEGGEQSYWSRCILLTDASVKQNEGDNEHLSLILLPSNDGMEICYAIEAGSRTGTTLNGLYLVYLFSRQKKSAKEDMKYYVDMLYSGEKRPNILWSCYFSVPTPKNFELIGNNCFLCPGPDFDLDYDNSIYQAKEIFKSMYPDGDFLPRAPDPEEIVFDGDDAHTDNPDSQTE